MAISDTIQSMYENVGEVYDTITNVTLPEHKNIENIPRTIRDSYLEIINNGINVIYDNWEKVTGEGTSLTLTPTEEAPMKIVYKGNTYQYSTSGKNLLRYTLAGLKISNITGTWNNNVYTLNGLTFTVNDDLTIKVNGTATGDSYTRFALYVNNLVLDTGSYYMSGCPSGGSASTYMIKLNVTGDNDTGSGKLITRTSTLTTGVFIQIETGTQLSNLTFKPMINTGTTAESYEMPIGITPNPDYPQEIQVVSGDNSIEISNEDNTKSASYPINLPVENLLNGNSIEYNSTNFSVTFENEIVSVTHLTSSTTGTPKFNLGILPKGTYCISQSGTFNAVSLNRDNVYSTMLRNSGDTFEANGTEEISIVLSNDTKTYSQIMLEKGTKANHYTPYGTTPIWLGWIPNTDYGDKIDKSTGKNLVEDKIVNGTIGSSGNIGANVSYDMFVAKVEENKTYTITTDENNLVCGFFYDKPTLGSVSYNNSRLVQSNKTFTAPITGYVAFRTNVDYATPMLNEGSTALPYEPYGTSWYLKKEIGKELIRPDTATIENNGVRTNAVVPKPIEAYPLLFCNYFGRAATYNGATNVNSTTPNKLGLNSSGLTICNILGYTTTTEYINFFANHNVYVYYPLATPTYTLIEGELLNQLEAIKMSYDGQTNISQTNNDLPFILNPSALEKV